MYSTPTSSAPGLVHVSVLSRRSTREARQLDGVEDLTLPRGLLSCCSHHPRRLIDLPRKGLALIDWTQSSAGSSASHGGLLEISTRDLVACDFRSIDEDPSLYRSRSGCSDAAASPVSGAREYRPRLPPALVLCASLLAASTPACLLPLRRVFVRCVDVPWATGALSSGLATGIGGDRRLRWRASGGFLFNQRVRSGDHLAPRLISSLAIMESPPTAAQPFLFRGGSVLRRRRGVTGIPVFGGGIGELAIRGLRLCYYLTATRKVTCHG